MNQNQTSSHRNELRPEISRGTLLVLSGFLLGIGFASQISVGLQQMSWLLGLAGLVGYIGIEFGGRKIEKHNTAQAIQRQSERAESRLDDHVTPTTRQHHKPNQTRFHTHN